MAYTKRQIIRKIKNKIKQNRYNRQTQYIYFLFFFSLSLQIVISMIFQQRKKNRTKNNNKQGWIFDPDYNHYKRIDQVPKTAKNPKNTNKYLDKFNKPTLQQKILPILDIQKLPSQSSQVVVLFDKYRILPMTERGLLQRKRILSGKCLQRTKFKQKAKYKRLHNTVKTIKNHRTFNIQMEIQVKNEKKYNNIKSQYNLSSNENQRTVQEPQNHTKFTHCSNSTKTPSQAFYHSNKQSPQPNTINKFKNKVKFSTSSLKMTDNIKIFSDDILRNPIPQQHSSLAASNSKTSKTNRNQSSVIPNTNSKVNLTHSNRSMYKSSLFLPVNSLKTSGQVENMSQLEGYSIIQDYIQYLNVLANYAQEITDYYENTDDWQELIFLTYKKYYLSRLKLFDALFYRNVFFFEVGSIKLTTQQIKSMKNFMNSQNGQLLRKQVSKQNTKISESLRNIYNLAIEKSGNYINLEQIDNFSCEIFRLMVQQIQELKNNFHAEPDLVKSRLKAILKCGATITVLDKRKEESQELNKLLKTPINLEVFQNSINLIKLKLI